MLLSALVVFLAMFALDFVWAKYTNAVTEKAAVKSGLLAVAILAFNGTVVIGYTVNHWMLIPAALGAFGGTYFAVRGVRFWRTGSI